MVAFLGIGDQGMAAARCLHAELRALMPEVDEATLHKAGHRLREVELQAPIPRPRLYFGLVQNTAKLLRNNLASVWNIYPQGHNRPQGSALGAGQPVYVASDAPRTCWNPELGLVIGKAGRDIPVDDARDYIVGLTVVLDMHNGYYHRLFELETDNPQDWFSDATQSWLGKLSDTMGTMGPYITTLDEIGDPYDLLVYSRQFGRLVDRSHTNSMFVSMERLVSWLSSFMELKPGDVLHMGSMGWDGIPIDLEHATGPDDVWEGEIEKVGSLKVPVVKAALGDWRDPNSPSRAVHPSPAVRRVIGRGECEIADPAVWSVSDVRHFWILYGNYAAAPELEGLSHCPLPRVIHSPASALSASGDPIGIAKRAATLQIGPELAFVVSRLASRVSEEEAAAHILGYVAMASITDDSFSIPLREPATPQARNMPKVYGRWGDGYNAVSLNPVPLGPDEVLGREMHLSVDGFGTVVTDTDQYRLLAPHILSTISTQITLFPGDVITFGRVAERLTIPSDAPIPLGTKLKASIDGIGTVECELADGRDATRYR